MNKRYFIPALIIAALSFTSACYGPQIIPSEKQGTSTSKMSKIKIGMSQEQVTNLAGTAGNSQTSDPGIGNMEAWQYFIPELTFQTHYIVWFNDGIVTGVNKDTKMLGGFRGNYITINWSKAPGYTQSILKSENQPFFTQTPRSFGD